MCASAIYTNNPPAPPSRLGAELYYARLIKSTHCQPVYLKRERVQSAGLKESRPQVGGGVGGGAGDGGDIYPPPF